MGKEAETGGRGLGEDGAVVEFLVVEGLEGGADVGVASKDGVMYWSWAPETGDGQS